ncbi:MAG: geranylgeranylglyceryl/heptaprenylglyceryl phosphate synthase [Calditrichaeota bacterium]|nr:MAG: geranylgeranylglyceryl/heptaprenylglyceryl phosphate synthase [Calditrichota bacterium]MBL1206370.1 geranylgeranylglyceryl/heptaprenylglyceryl phosphate synthase [Calditrichota bacterium]NOG46196.1 geranylgeranylglyceryl/heptaprenylglyceryl phosphate synthase [Calditrichota bacterium]
MIIKHFKLARNSAKAAFVILIDPDKIENENIPGFIERCISAGVDIFFIGGSLLNGNEFDNKIKLIKSHAENIPVIIFPGNVNQLSQYADALLYLSLISGRNPDYLIGNQVLAAPVIRKSKIESISTAYMLIESGKTTSVEFMSGTKPIPNDKVDIAIAHALAAEYLGFKVVYLEAGSGAKNSVPEDMIKGVSHSISLPIIVGGGIKSPDEANQKVLAGANIIVIGNHFEKNNNSSILQEFSSAIHTTALSKF